MTTRFLVTIRFLTTDEGGRRRLPASWKGYAPHFVVNGDSAYLGMLFLGGPNSSAGEWGQVVVQTLYDPHVDYGFLRPATRFEVREGPKPVGHGEIVQILKP